MVESVGNLEHDLFMELGTYVKIDGFGFILGTKEIKRK